ncbi:hypothetical protein F0562_017487 [Nyssa sinensis]|uniref:Uncharacterized protein n=1 Tax=Nyssa sinensis TaxID=561372 RepID=A0A5J4ZHR6_9ASTE|nr:hypothetical protein F0562_017487 [Nyssa sinensis]
MAVQLLRPLGREIGYLAHYKENIQKLDEEIKGLGENRGRLQRKVDEATNRGEIVEDNVCQWLTDVGQRKEEVDQFLGEQLQEHKRKPKREERLFRGLKMEIVNAAVGRIVEQITEWLMRSMRRQIGYLVHYKENIQKLDEEIKELGENRGRLQRKVDEATNRGEIVEDNVNQWLTDAGQRKEEVDQFLGEQLQEHKRCFHFCSRYRVSKEAKGKQMLLLSSKIMAILMKLHTLLLLRNLDSNLRHITRHLSRGFRFSTRSWRP